jgi:biopolymer transport protein ExbB/biopolymer transport protein TolQ
MDFTLVGLWNEMGIVARGVVVVLVVMSLYSLAITGERLVTFWRSRKQSRLYIAALAPMVESAGRLRDAVGLDKRFAGSSVASVIGAGLTEYARGLDRTGAAPPAFEVAEVVNRAMERSKERELAGLRRGMPVLATVASSAPFVGLFGTVGGIITAFQKLADPTKGGGGIGTVSAGIAEALVTTAFGLLVAIPAVMAFNFLQGWVDARSVDISESSNEFLDVVAKQLGGHGHMHPPQA